MSSSIDKARCELLTRALGERGQITIQASGTSMLPFLWPARPLRITRIAAGNLRPGDIALYRHEDGFIAHRFYARRGNGYLFKGDFRLRFDRVVRAEAIVGQVEPLFSGRLAGHLWKAANLLFVGAWVRPLVRRWQR